MEVVEELEFMGKDYFWIMFFFCVGFLRNFNVFCVYLFGSLGKVNIMY